MRQSVESAGLRLFGWLVLTVAAGYILLPVIAISVESVRGVGSTTLEWYRHGLHNHGFWKAFATSLVLAVGVGITSVLLGFCSVRLVLRLSRRVRVLAFLIISLPVLLPVLVSGFALHAYFSALGIDGTLPGLFLAQVAYISPIAFFLLNLAQAGLNPETEECSRNLGASEFDILVDIVLPQLKVPIIFTALVCALISWDEFVITWFVGGFYRTIPVMIYGMLGSTLDRSIYALATMITITSFFVLIVAVVVNRKSLFRALDRA